MSDAPTPDVLVAGAGIIGCSLALRLARAGMRVAVVDPGTPGMEATWAAGGMLSPLGEAPGAGPFLRLGRASLDRYPAWVADIVAASGVPVEYRRHGKLEVALDDEALETLRSSIGWRRTEGARAEWLDGAAARALEPALSPEVRGAVLLEEDHAVDNRALGRALWAAAAAAGVTFRLGAGVRAVERLAGRAGGVRLEDGARLAAGAVVLAAGCWSGGVDGLPAPLPVFPVRGQMVAAGAVPPPIQRVVASPGQAYLVPRAQGRVVVGSTMEHAGFHAVATVGGSAGLMAAAARIVPALAAAALVETWAGLRPGTPDGLPILGEDPALPGLFYATGHFRNGILLAPITAELVAAQVRGEEPPLPVAELGVERFRDADA